MRETPVDISVVLSTYNRAAMLPAALEALLTQRTTVAYEVILVDNNSTDGTREVAARYVTGHPGRVRYVFERQQGLSYGRNTGIAAARGAVIAFTDDDVEVAPDWVERLARAFESHPDVAYVGGRVLPQWTVQPPRWLTTAHWSPLAVQDYGDEPVRVGAAWPVCLVGANLAFRRSVFDRVGLFTPSFGRIKDGIGSTEDHEMQLRLWQVGLEGLYVPDVRMMADVTPDRMTKAYHRRWHAGHGRHCARMRLREHVPQDFAPMGRPDNLVSLFGIPAFVYLELPKMALRWIQAFARRRDSFFYENRLRHLASYLAEGWRLHRAESRKPAVAEVWRFLASYTRKAGSRFLKRLGPTRVAVPRS
jgi:glucosyl-dolichyl phosphate glucuronosyltransferase